MLLHDYEAARKQLVESLETTLDLRVQLDPHSKKGGHIISGKPGEEMSWNVDGIPDLSLIHISEPTRPY